MDKRNTIIGVALLLAAFGSFFLAQRYAPPPPPPRPPDTVRPADPVTPGDEAAPLRPSPGVATTDNGSPRALPAADNALQEIVTLGNEHVVLSFTNFGGAIRDAALLRFPAVKGSLDPYVFNQLRYAPALSFVDFPGLDRHTPWQLVSQGDGRVVYRAVVDRRVEVTRTYRLPRVGEGGDPYRLRQEVVFRNLSDEPVGAQRIALNLGTAAPVSSADTGYHLNVGSYDGNKAQFVRRDALMGGGFLAWIGLRDGAPKPVIERIRPLTWASVKNQFFTSVLTADGNPGVGVTVRLVDLPAFPDSTKPNIGVTGNALFDLPRIEPGDTARLDGWFYVGPKEYHRLANFDHREDLVMDFGFFGFFSKILLTLMNWFYALVPNYGVAIILTTIALKTVFLPLTLAAAKSSKRMAKIQPLMKELQSKYDRSDPKQVQKQQREMLDLFKQHRVNPLGGCLPILVTIPFFIGFFQMLQSASELRFAEFLWVADLSAPDTVWRPLGFPLNIMPLLMCATMVIQMRLVPTPTMDNAQARILKMMPYVMLIFCYGFSSALSLYWTVSNVYTIGQQLVINRMKDDEPLPASGTAPAAAGKGVAAKPAAPTAPARTVPSGSRKKRRR
jgi:YidC/Oxa1 family membrane protein insertase